MAIRAASIRYWMITGIYLVVCAVLLGAFYGLILQPQNRQRVEVRREMKEMIEQYDQAQQSRNDHSRNQLKKGLESVREQWNRFVVEPGKVSSLAFTIGQVANDLNVAEFNARRMEMQTRDEMQDFTCLGESWMQMDFRGGFAQFASLVNRLERNRPVLFVEEFVLKQGTDANANPRADVTVCHFIENPNAADSKKSGGSRKKSDPSTTESSKATAQLE